VDEKLEALKRAVKKDPGDPAAAVRYASALEKAGRFDEAWELLSGADAGEALAALARLSPLRVLDRLRALDYHRARLMMEQLAGLGLPDHPAIVLLASAKSDDPILKLLAQRTITASFDLGSYISPEYLNNRVEWGGFGPGFIDDRPAVRPIAERKRASARSFALRVLEKSGSANALALLPWLIPLLTSGDAALAARALEAVRRLTHRDHPPFDTDLLARLLEQKQGEPA